MKTKKFKLHPIIAIVIFGVFTFSGLVMAADDFVADDFMDVPEKELPEGFPTSVDKNNYKEVEHMLAPTQIERITEYDMHFNVIPTQRNYKVHPRYDEYTKKNKGKVRIEEGNLVNHEAGLPFPDPQTGEEVIWNFHEKYYADDRMYFETNADIVDSKGNVRNMGNNTINKRWTGRVQIEPIPKIPNEEGIMYKEINVTPAPPQVRGLGILFIRYEDADKADDAWSYVPALRRARRMSTSQRDEHLGGSDTTWDDFNDFNAKIVTHDYKLVEKKQMLICPQSATNEEVENKEYEYEYTSPLPSWQGGDYQIMPIYVVDGIPKDPDYVYSKRRFYISPLDDIYEIFYEETWDQEGRLWKHFEQRFVYADSPHGDWKNHYVHLSSYVDHIAKHGTMWDIGHTQPVKFDQDLPNNYFTLQNLASFAK